MTKVKKPNIRVRLAPSPTGSLHVGTARTGLFNWLFAKHHTGTFILRVEDTDPERSKKEFEDDIVESLKWLGLEWDEFYRQTDRTKIYTKYIQKLLNERKAFWCYHTGEELELEGKEQIEKKELPRHVCAYKHEAPEINSENRRGVIRLAVDENSDKKIIFNDLIKGRIEFAERLFGDISIARNVNSALYHFAVVIDDHEMNISHIIRGEDHITNTPKYMLIAQALGFSNPEFAHIPLILGQDRAKLSKRNGAISVKEYRNKGYLPEAIVNYLALLGWSPENADREILTKNELIEKFDLSKIHKAGAFFDIKKLNSINSQYLKMLNDEGIKELVKPAVDKFFGRQDEEILLKIAPLFRKRLEYTEQVKEFHYFFKRPEYDRALLVWKKSDLTGAKMALEKAKESITHEVSFDENCLHTVFNIIARDNFGGDKGAVYWPVRVALSGEKYSADPVETAVIIGQAETLARIDNALAKIE